MTMTGKLIPFGYTAKDAEERLVTLMEDEKSVLIDIRFKPYSRWRPTWGINALIKRWGLNRYQWEGNVLGNMNYNTDLPIKLVMPEYGVERLIERLRHGESLILLCACKNYETCHRRVVVELVRQVLPEVEVVE